MLIKDIKDEMRRLGIKGVSSVNKKNKQVFIELINRERRKRKRVKRLPKAKTMIDPKRLKVKKIVYEKEYWIKCDVCGRKLKKCVQTNQGDLGWRCYLSTIGVPVPDRFRGNLKKLPFEAFESIALTVIKRMMNAPRQKLFYAVSRIPVEDMKERFVGTPKFHSYNHVSYKVKNYSGVVKKGYGTVDMNLWLISGVLGFDSTILNKVRGTKAFERWWFINQGVAQANPHGVTYRKDLYIPPKYKKELVTFARH